MFKKTLLIIVVSLTMLFSSCTDNNDNNKITTTTTLNEVPRYAKEFQYKGHDYILFRWKSGCYDDGMGYVHNPECKKCFDIFD